MPSDPLILAFDTSAAHCAAALLRGDDILVSAFDEMVRGQAEHLMPLLERVLAEADHSWQDLDAIGVGVGPGNFTGIRISVSAARGLALALDIPAIGVNSFDAITKGAAQSQPTNGLPCVPGPRGQAYVAPAGIPPYLATAEQLDELAQDVTLLSPGYASLTQHIARCAAQRMQDAVIPAPAPLYIKAADAAPPRDPAPMILDDDA